MGLHVRIRCVGRGQHLAHLLREHAGDDVWALEEGRVAGVVADCPMRVAIEVVVERGGGPRGGLTQLREQVLPLVADRSQSRRIGRDALGQGDQLATRLGRGTRGPGQEAQRPRDVPAEELLADHTELVDSERVGRVETEVQRQAPPKKILQTVEMTEKVVVVEGGEVDAPELTDLRDEGRAPFVLPTVEDAFRRPRGDRGPSRPGTATQRGCQSCRQPHRPRGRRRTVLASEWDHALVHLAAQGTLLDAFEQQSELFRHAVEDLRGRRQVDGCAERRERRRIVGRGLEPEALRGHFEIRGDGKGCDRPGLKHEQLTLGTGPLDVLG